MAASELPRRVNFPEMDESHHKKLLKSRRVPTEIFVVLDDSNRVRGYEDEHETLPK